MYYNIYIPTYMGFVCLAIIPFIFPKVKGVQKNDTNRNGENEKLYGRIRMNEKKNRRLTQRETNPFPYSDSNKRY